MHAGEERRGEPLAGGPAVGGGGGRSSLAIRAPSAIQRRISSTTRAGSGCGGGGGMGSPKRGGLRLDLLDEVARVGIAGRDEQDVDLRALTAGAVVAEQIDDAVLDDVEPQVSFRRIAGVARQAGGAEDRLNVDVEKERRPRRRSVSKRMALSRT